MTFQIYNLVCVDILRFYVSYFLSGNATWRQKGCKHAT